MGRGLGQQSDAIKKDLLAAFIEHGTITAACRKAGINRSTWYEWIQRDPEFAKAVETARESVADDLEEEAIRRAKDGSDLMLIFLLKGHKPDKYADRRKVEGTLRVTSLEELLDDDGDD